MTTDTLVALRCDAGRETGVGHAVRLLALAQELRGRGVPVRLYGELAVAWVAEAYAALDVPIHPADALGSAPATHAVLDGYPIPAAVGTSLRARGVRTLAMVDGPYGDHQDADVYVDQNYGAVPLPVGPDRHAVAGISYALFRDNVLAARDRPRTPGPRPRVLVVFGGTDPQRACPDYARALLDTGRPVEIVAVAADEEIEQRLEAMEPGPEQHLRVVRTPPDLPALAAGCDAAVSAAGSTVWELLAIGVPTASVCVVDNQEPGYATTWRDGVVLPAGRLPVLRAGDEQEQRQRHDSLQRLVTDEALRLDLAASGRRLVDGLGRERVADLLLGRA